MANGKPKKSKKKLYIFGGLGLLIVALIVFAFVNGNKEEIVQVQTEKVVKRNITQSVTATGNLDPKYKVVITPEVTGEIVSLPVKEGDVVKKGDLLLKIKSDNYVAQVDQSKADLKSAKATLAMRKAELDKVESDYNRTKELNAKGLASASEFEAAKSTYLSQKASYEGAEANVMQSEAVLKQRLDQLSKAIIYSPMAGVITKLNVELGERILGSGFSQGTDMMTVSDLKSMEAIVDVDENDVVLIAPNDTARIKIDAFGDKVFKGLVTQIGNSAITAGLGTQEQVVNFEVKLSFLDFNPDFRPGMSCNASIETETKDNVISVPIQSVTSRDMGMKKMDEGGDENNPNMKKKSINEKPKEIVFVVNQGKVKSVPVTTGISDDNYIEVKTGLKAGEEVVSGSYRAISKELQDGSKVRVEDKRKPMASK